ncbi:pleckstrin homology domain-containing family A member 1-like [Hydractinia symbiolongicarpus]|uniref:pleckstrin homology domain-containing family A member 1-like n=1 Tax=Hydractinia symbiolongicarpus TaxID=13093 RepID=UPI00254E85D2|nr:pleckstrin homology domain-containing family A member 1-like [Hydractinia symbiolongicarpus]
MSGKNNVGKLGDVMMEDWMIKSPPVEKLNQLQSWRRRYFALLHINHKNTVPHKWSKKGSKSLENLHDVYLVYWKDDKDRKNGVKPIGTIPIFKTYSVSECKPPNFEKTHHHVILLDTIERKFYLCADTEKARKKWIKELSNAIESTLHVDAKNSSKEPIYEAIQNIMSEPTYNASRNSSSASSRSSTSDEFDQSRRLTEYSLYEEMGPCVERKEKEQRPRSRTEGPPRVPPRESGKQLRRPRSLVIDESISKNDNAHDYTDNGHDKNNHSNRSPASKTVANEDFETIVFLDIKLEVPHATSIEYSEDGLKVTTPDCQCVFSKIE